MDFVVSKVAMAICALFVISIVAGLFSGGILLGGERGFERILSEFCGLTDRLAASRCESSVTWNVPFLPGGEAVTFTVHHGTILVESNEGSAASRPSYGMHLWRTDGRCLNDSTVAALDEGTGSLTFDSGQTVEIVSRSLIYEDEPRFFIFVYPAD